MLNADKFEITSALLKELAEADVGQTLSIIMRIRSEAISECKFAIVDALKHEVTMCSNVERNSELGKKTSKNKFEDLTPEEWAMFYNCQTARQIAERMTQVARAWPHHERGSHGYPVDIIHRNVNELVEELRKIEGDK